MTRRRIIEPGTTWALSRRATRRHFLLNPQFAAAGHRGAAKEAVQRIRAFNAQYDRALAAWTSGKRSIRFPVGTWWMRVCHGARCGPGP